MRMNKESSMRGPEYLESQVGILKTRMGACFPGSHATFRGHNLHTELQDRSWLELYLFGITGRRFSVVQLKLLEAIWIYTSYPDARIWNNRVAALAGTLQSTGSLGVSAALSVSEAAIYGHQIMVRAGEFFELIKKQMDSGESATNCVLKELKRSRNLAGYGRPINSTDERIDPILQRAHELKLDSGSYLALAFHVADILAEKRLRLKINYAAVAAALVLDTGINARELYFFVVPSFLAGIPPCYIEAERNPLASTFPISSSHVSYCGANKRRWTNGNGNG